MLYLLRHHHCLFKLQSYFQGLTVCSCHLAATLYEILGTCMAKKLFQPSGNPARPEPRNKSVIRFFTRYIFYIKILLTQSATHFKNRFFAIATTKATTTTATTTRPLWLAHPLLSRWIKFQFFASIHFVGLFCLKKQQLMPALRFFIATIADWLKSVGIILIV